MSSSIRHNSPTPVELLGGWRVLQVHGSPDDRIVQLAAAQHGRVTRSQLLAAGLTRSMIQTRIDRRQLQQAHRGVYVAGHLTDTALGRETSALLACRARAVLSHLTAARAWRLVRPEPSDAIDVLLVGTDGTHIRRGIRAHRTVFLPAQQIRRIQGLPVTSPERTLLDIAPLITGRQLERALDEALALRITSRTKLASLLTKGNGHQGVPRLAPLLDVRRRSTVTRSGTEEQLLQLIRDAGLPDPVLQAPLHGFTVDAYWPEARFGVEVDGYPWHAVKTNFERDRRKDRVLQQHGIQLTRTTSDQIRDEPLQVVAHIAQTLALRSRRLALASQ